MREKEFFIFFKKKSNFFCNITQLPKHYIFWTKHKTNRAVQSTTFFKSFNFFDRFLIKIREVVCFRRTRWTQRKNRKILWNFNTSYVVAMPHDECKVTNNLQMSRISLLGLILRKTWVSTSFWCNFLFFSKFCFFLFVFILGGHRNLFFFVSKFFASCNCEAEFYFFDVRRKKIILLWFFLRFFFLP